MKIFAVQIIDDYYEFEWKNTSLHSTFEKALASLGIDTTQENVDIQKELQHLEITFQYKIVEIEVE